MALLYDEHQNSIALTTRGSTRNAHELQPYFKSKSTHFRPVLPTDKTYNDKAPCRAVQPV